MTTFKMRSSEAVPASFVRPKLNQRHYNQVQPLWMRVLEEKYQKLQLKIAQSTATMNGLYSTAIGRTIYDTKLIRASLQKTNEPTQNAQNVKRRNANFDIKAKISATRISSNPGVLKTSDNGVPRKNVFTNSDIKQEINDRYSSDDESVNIFDKDSKINDSGSTKVSELLCLRYDKNQSNKKEFSELISKKIKSKLSISQTLGKESNMQTADYASSRHSLSTQKTIQSCPANVTDEINTVPKARSKSRVESAGKSKINRRKMKMFSRMSAEAQTALTETIMEHISDGNISDSEMEDCKKENTNHVQLEDNVFETGCVLSFEDINDINKRNNCSDSEVSAVSRDSQSTHTKLPVIPNENQEFLTLRHIRQVNCKVPGLGKSPYATKREPTFEITPPGFDIRYKDAPIREERESETPPPDIRDRAIRKCQDWLSRYTPRTQRASQTSN